MSYDNLSSVSQNVLKFYQQLTGKERRVPFILYIYIYIHVCTRTAVMKVQTDIITSIAASPMTLVFYR
jgi:hypothetical protein